MNVLMDRAIIVRMDLSVFLISYVEVYEWAQEANISLKIRGKSPVLDDVHHVQGISLSPKRT